MHFLQILCMDLSGFCNIYGLTVCGVWEDCVSICSTLKMHLHYRMGTEKCVVITVNQHVDVQ